MEYNLGKTIRILRQAKGLKVGELARETQISTPFLSLVENAERQPSLDVIRRIAAALGVPSEALVLMSAGSTSSLRTGDPAVESITRSVENLMQAERNLRKLLGSEETTDAMDRHHAK